MNNLRCILWGTMVGCSTLVFGQKNGLRNDTINGGAIQEVIVRAVISQNGISHLPEVYGGVNYSGKKTEVLVLDSLNANTAQDNPRQVLGRIPGSNYSETQGSGFPSNGIGFRGLVPTQSIETNTRQNGYNITADIYGYPESYYIPPMEAVERIEFIRGASAISFGPQFGGVVNYVLKSPPKDKTIEFTTGQTMGSNGLFSSYNAIGGTLKKWSYMAFIKDETAQGWRANSDFRQTAAFGQVNFMPNEKIKLTLEYSLLNNQLHMPGGLLDEAFNADPSQSFRTRNWMTSPWNVLTLGFVYDPGNETSLRFTSTGNASSRNIVWRSEDGGPGSLDTINPLTLHYQPREVLHENFRSTTNELRLTHHYLLYGQNQLFATGVRVFYGWMNRLEGGTGTTASNCDFTDSANYYPKNMAFTTLNIAPYIENTFHFGNKFSVTPGIRFEYIRSTAQGNVLADDGSILSINTSTERYIPLAGLGMQFKVNKGTQLYLNLTQCYTPISYSLLYPLGLDTNAKIDPKLKDINGYNFDLGWRGHWGKFSFDLGGFMMGYNNAIGFEHLKDGSGNGYIFETNIANSVHQGLETYIEYNAGVFSCFNSFAFDDARYVSGPFKGNYSVYAPKAIERAGVSLTFAHFSSTLQMGYTSLQYSDANNTLFSANALTGVIPAFTVLDWSSTVKVQKFRIKFGINNLGDAHYFTFRAIEYPGPGIIPSVGRSFYVGFGATF